MKDGLASKSASEEAISRSRTYELLEMIFGAAGGGFLAALWCTGD